MKVRVFEKSVSHTITQETKNQFGKPQVRADYLLVDWEGELVAGEPGTPFYNYVGVKLANNTIVRIPQDNISHIVELEA